jgi:hypothetical protein
LDLHRGGRGIFRSREGRKHVISDSVDNDTDV